jgi:hypothetical protein
MIECKHLILGAASLALSLSLSACSQNYSSNKVDEALKEKGLARVEAVTAPGRQSREAERLSAPAYDAGGEKLSLPGLNALVPAGWQQRSPSSSMRIAEFGLKPSAGGSEEASLAVFKGPMGSVEGNIDRWIGQFDDVTGSERWEVSLDGDTRVTMLDVAGTFTGSMGSTGRQEGYRLLGAIVGEGSYYLKLLGPGSTVEEWKASFDEFIGSISTN